jgi:hypothetical protein
MIPNKHSQVDAQHRKKTLTPLVPVTLGSKPQLWSKRYGRKLTALA